MGRLRTRVSTAGVVSSLLPGGLSLSTVRMLALRMTAGHSSVIYLAGSVIYLAVQPL